MEKNPWWNTGNYWSFPYLWHIFGPAKGPPDQLNLGRCFAKGTDPQKGAKTKTKMIRDEAFPNKSLTKSRQPKIHHSCMHRGPELNIAKLLITGRQLLTQCLPLLQRQSVKPKHREPQRSGDPATLLVHGHTHPHRSHGSADLLAQISRHMVCTDSTPGHSQARQ